jgi:hypothetical protein
VDNLEPTKGSKKPEFYILTWKRIRQTHIS